MWHANGKLSDEVPMVHGKMQGVWQAYYATGERMFEQTYADGKLNGPATRFYQSGKKEEYGIHENGQKDGVWISWHENGQKKGEDEYENGARIDRQRFARQAGKQRLELEGRVGLALRGACVAHDGPGGNRRGGDVAFA